MTTESALRVLLGGALIGLAAAIALIAHGRIAGISGTLGRALDGDDDDGRPVRLAFLVGLVATGVIGAQLVPGAFGANVAGIAQLAIAGLLVGVGTTLGNGCTSGHGVCGISRGSRRSFVAVAVFMATAMVTATIRGAL
ncbi:MAG: YeeE/YedE family protein [Deltaproteobacteria bacterium]|nr:YeeE/YedE family protein [Deltaproteobacteria bacterium]